MQTVYDFWHDLIEERLWAHNFGHDAYFESNER